MTTQFQLTCCYIILVIQAGFTILYLFRSGIPRVLISISALFWGLSCAWERLWEVYHCNVATVQEPSIDRLKGILP